MTTPERGEVVAVTTVDSEPPLLVTTVEADAVTVLEARDTVRDRLDTWSIQNALATLPSEALFPTLPPAARRMLSALFASDEPLDRQDLTEITSESSYDRHWQTLREFFLVERTEEGLSHSSNRGGRRRTMSERHTTRIQTQSSNRRAAISNSLPRRAGPTALFSKWQTKWSTSRSHQTDTTNSANDGTTGNGSSQNWV